MGPQVRKLKERNKMSSGVFERLRGMSSEEPHDEDPEKVQVSAVQRGVLSLQPVPLTMRALL